MPLGHSTFARGTRVAVTLARSGRFGAGTSDSSVLVGHGCSEDWNSELGRRLEGCQ